MASGVDGIEAARVPDPTKRSLPGIKSRASMAAAEQLERLSCLHMMGEYRQCISANHQFHQYYIHGRFSQCKVQKARMFNCMKWKTSHDEKAKEDLLRSFEEEQLAMHAPRPVWRLRETAPADWSSPDTGSQPSTAAEEDSRLQPSDHRPADM